MKRQFAAGIEGVTPFLFNRYVEDQEVVERIGPKPKDASKVDEWRQKEGMLRVYENGGSGPVLPGRNIRATMINGAHAGGITHKPGKGRPMGLGPFLRRGLLIEPAWVEFGKVKIDLHRDLVRVPPRTGATVVKYWPKLEDWRLKFQLVVFDDSLQGESELKESLEAAGVFCGLGTGRPDYGKFRVVTWEEVEA